MGIVEKLEKSKEKYPFTYWESLFKEGLEQYTPENVSLAKGVIDKLIDKLTELGISASDEEKIEAFKVAVESLNALNDELDGCLIETGEREQLCDLFNEITIAVGLDPQNFGDGEGIASEWRDW